MAIHPIGGRRPQSGLERKARRHSVRDCRPDQSSLGIPGVARSMMPPDSGAGFPRCDRTTGRTGFGSDGAAGACGTRPDGERTADVAIVGAGYTGLSAALHLAGQGVDVIVLEAEEAGFGGSGRNVGLVNAGMWVRPRELPNVLGPVHGKRLLDLLGGGPAAVFDLIERHGIACEATRAGTLHCGVGEEGPRSWPDAQPSGRHSARRWTILTVTRQPRQSAAGSTVPPCWTGAPGPYSRSPMRGAGARRARRRRPPVLPKPGACRAPHRRRLAARNAARRRHGGTGDRGHERLYAGVLAAIAHRARPSALFQHRHPPFVRKPRPVHPAGPAGMLGHEGDFDILPLRRA